MTDNKLWELAQKQAAKEYEEECGSWEDADKYERADWVFNTYLELIKEESTMSRVDNIANFAQKRDAAKAEQEMELARRIENYKAQIRALKPRIDELLIVGNACLEHGIELTGSDWKHHEGYDTHQFFSNGWSHLCGFVRNFDPETRKPLPITKVGKLGGGACDWNLTTDGIDIDVTGDVARVLRMFLEEFDEFETEFYQYVDKVTS